MQGQTLFLDERIKQFGAPGVVPAKPRRFIVTVVDGVESRPVIGAETAFNQTVTA